MEQRQIIELPPSLSTCWREELDLISFMNASFQPKDSPNKQKKTQNVFLLQLPGKKDEVKSRDVDTRD